MIGVYLLISIVAAGFFAGLETGLLSANRMLLQAKKKEGLLHARVAEYFLARPERLFGTTLVGTNVAHVTASVMLTNYMVDQGLEKFAWLAIIAMTFVVLILSEFIPKSFFRRTADSLTTRLAPLLFVFYLLFFPLNLVLNFITKMLMFLSRQHANRREELRSKRDLRFLVNIACRGVGLPFEDQRIIEDIFDFRDQTAREVMIPFHQLPVLNVRQARTDAAALAHETGYRFIPVSETRTDNMIGYIDTRDLLWGERDTLKEVIREAVFYPEVRRLPDLLLEMNQRRLEVVFLSDEYGGVAGMITQGQIVGDLFHYVPEKGMLEEKIKKLGPGRFLVAGSTDLQDLCHEINVVLDQGLNSTIGGFLSEKMGVIAEVGDAYEEAGFVFTVTGRDARHITAIEAVRKDPDREP